MSYFHNPQNIVTKHFIYLKDTSQDSLLLERGARQFVLLLMRQNLAFGSLKFISLYKTFLIMDAIILLLLQKYCLAKCPKITLLFIIKMKILNLDIPGSRCRGRPRSQAAGCSEWLDGRARSPCGARSWVPRHCSRFSKPPPDLRNGSAQGSNRSPLKENRWIWR